jgi:hypothetical protein
MTYKKKTFYSFHLTVVQPGTAPVHMLAVKGQELVVFGVLKQNYS